MEMQVWSISKRWFKRWLKRWFRRFELPKKDDLKGDLKDDLKDDCDLRCPEKVIEKMIATWRAPKKMIWGSGFTPRGSGSAYAVCPAPTAAWLTHVAKFLQRRPRGCGWHLSEMSCFFSSFLVRGFLIPCANSTFFMFFSSFCKTPFSCFFIFQTTLGVP